LLEPERVGLEHPTEAGTAIGLVELQNQSICGSSGAKRKWAQYTHILNPHTKSSPPADMAVWVVADTALLADGLATALFFAEPHILTQHFSFEYCIYRAGEAEVSATFPGTLFTT
jgi:FAD:protein FMN transferase